MSDFYALLGIKSTATDDQIKQAYRKNALKWHPDKNPKKPDAAKKRFQEISNAYEVLSDSKRRREYDNIRKYGNTRSSAAASSATPGSSRERPQARQNSMPQTFEFEDSFSPHGRSNRTNFDAFAMHRDPFDLFRAFFADAGINNVMGGGFFDVAPISGSRIAHFSTTSSPIHVSSTRVSTQMVNGKALTVRRVMENGVETVSTFENGQLVSQTARSSNQSVSRPSGSRTGGRTWQDSEALPPKKDSMFYTIPFN